MCCWRLAVDRAWRRSRALHLLPSYSGLRIWYRLRSFYSPLQSLSQPRGLASVDPINPLAPSWVRQVGGTCRRSRGEKEREKGQGIYSLLPPSGSLVGVRWLSSSTRGLNFYQVALCLNPRALALSQGTVTSGWYFIIPCLRPLASRIALLIIPALNSSQGAPFGWAVSFGTQDNSVLEF